MDDLFLGPFVVFTTSAVATPPTTCISISICRYLKPDFKITMHVKTMFNFEYLFKLSKFINRYTIKELPNQFKKYMVV